MDITGMNSIGVGYCSVCMERKLVIGNDDDGICKCCLDTDERFEYLREILDAC